jgi:hypothetical protein
VPRCARRPGVFQEPWVYESSTARARDRLLAYVREMQGVRHPHSLMHRLESGLVGAMVASL